ncbi:MAG: NAD(P)/FAD-dependent oxidoreductase [Desulfobacteraceae bacterium]|nr:NAD(P)/FAD-dependent oxidoreductase [Desulfobacteraceae bacterium]
MKKTDEFDIRFLIIGTGPAGNAAAIRLAQLGAKSITIIERGPIGGICVNRGCIPTHSMLHFLKLREYFSEIKQRHRLFNKLPEIDFHALASTRKKLIENPSAIRHQRKL